MHELVRSAADIEQSQSAIHQHEASGLAEDTVVAYIRLCAIRLGDSSFTVISKQYSGINPGF